MITQISQGVKVSVNPKYQPQFSDVKSGHHLFAYTITIENLTDKTIQLLRRVWFVFDSCGKHKKIMGDGVVGEQPILEPGQAHEYISACSLFSEFGSMRGYYIFNSLQSTAEFEVDIPEFYLMASYKLN